MSKSSRAASSLIAKARVIACLAAIRSSLLVRGRSIAFERKATGKVSETLKTQLAFD
jgi:hypothetical protein